MARIQTCLALVLAVGAVGFWLLGCSDNSGKPDNQPVANISSNNAASNDSGSSTEPDPEPAKPELPTSVDELQKAAAKIINNRACHSCHWTEGDDLEKDGPVIAPPLARIAERRPGKWLRDWLKTPAIVRQNQLERMPDLALSDYEVEVLARYLEHQAADNIAKLPKTELKREEKPKYGRMITARRIFSKYNCGNCHSLGRHKIRIQRDDDGKIVFQPSAERAPDLTNAHARVRPEWLKAMLTHPPTWMPWSRMPELDIEEEDIEDLAWYIMNFRQK